MAVTKEQVNNAESTWEYHKQTLANMQSLVDSDNQDILDLQQQYQDIQDQINNTPSGTNTDQLYAELNQTTNLIFQAKSSRDQHTIDATNYQQQYVDPSYNDFENLQSQYAVDESSPINATTQNPIQPVSSGSGQSTITTVSVPASQYAQDNLDSSNASLVNTNTPVPLTRDTQVTGDLLVAANQSVVNAQASLDGALENFGYDSPEYASAKADLIDAQTSYESARDDFEDSLGQSDQAVANDLLNTDINPEVDPVTSLDLTDENNQLNAALGTTPSSDAPPDGTSPDITVTGHKIDVRVRLRPKERNGTTYPFFGDKDSVLYMLNETNGAFFPYTPTITLQHKVNYSQMTPTHANTDYYTYTNTPAVQIQIEGQFSAQNLDEARYTLACMHFFRSATKMHFGEYERQQGTAGLPPPPLVLSGYGEFMFNELTVILTDFSMNLPNNVNYLEVTMSDGTLAWVPSLTTMTVNCVVQQTPKQQKEEFNLADFVNGKMFGHGSATSGAADKGWI